MDNSPITMPGVLSLSSLAMEAILKQEIPTPPSSLPTNLLEDISNLMTSAGSYRLTSYSIKSYNQAQAPLPSTLTSCQIFPVLSVSKPTPDSWRFVMGVGRDEVDLEISLGRGEEGEKKWV